jgi:hypothetical protein
MKTTLLRKDMRIYLIEKFQVSYTCVFFLSGIDYTFLESGILLIFFHLIVHYLSDFLLFGGFLPVTGLLIPLR